MWYTFYPKWSQIHAFKWNPVSKGISSLPAFFSYTFVSGGKPIGGLGTKPQLYEALLFNCEFFLHLSQ